jgi:hypothetical protein
MDEDGWFWLSFADGDRPVGEQFLGACLVEVKPDPVDEFVTSGMIAARRGLLAETIIDPLDIAMARAVHRAHELGINPGGEVQIVAIPGSLMPSVAESDRERLLNREEAEAIGA